MNRWFYALVGVLSMLLAGFVYAWSILSAPMAADFAAWSASAFSFTFTICMACFCLGSMAAGLLAKRMPPKRCLGMAAALFLAGFFITSRAQTLAALYLGYGVLAGLAAGLGYGAVMNIVPRHFPDKPGLIPGLLLMGFGTSSLIIGTLFTAITPEAPGAWRSTLPGMGAGIAALLLVASFLLDTPKAAAQAAAKSGAAARDYAPRDMLRTRSFPFFFLWALLFSATGLVVISQSRSMLLQVAPGMAAATVSLLVGSISVCNGLGRVLFGALFDGVGRGKALALLCAANFLGPLLLMLGLRGPVLLLVAGFVFTGLGYGGTPTMNAALVKRFYGPKHYPLNYPIIVLSLLPASFVPTFTSAMAEKAGGFTGVCLLCMAMGLLGAFLVLCMDRGAKKEGLV